MVLIISLKEIVDCQKNNLIEIFKENSKSHGTERGKVLLKSFLNSNQIISNYKKNILSYY